MKRFLLRLLALALIAGAIALMLTPMVARQYRLWRDAQIVSEYRRAADALSALDCGTLLAEARRQNDGLSDIGLKDAFASQASADAGDGLLELNGDGVMAVLEIPKLGARLPVYDSASEDAMRLGASHLEGTSLPVGGAGAHCVLAGRGDRRAAGPFAGLDRLIPGDCFVVRVLQDALVYEVDQVQTLEAGALTRRERPVDGDFCTLMSEASYDGGDQRLLVRGRRIERREAPLQDDTQALPAWAARALLAAPVAAAGLIVLALIEAVRRAVRRHRLRRIRL